MLALSSASSILQIKHLYFLIGTKQQMVAKMNQYFKGSFSPFKDEGKHGVKFLVARAGISTRFSFVSVFGKAVL